MKKIILASLMLAGVLIFSGCSLYGNSAPSTPSSAPAVAPTTANEISIQNFAFNPATLTVAKGTTITWINNDSAPHQIKADTFNSESLGKGQKFSFTFNETGAFDYTCGIHPSMKGKIIVQ